MITIIVILCNLIIQLIISSVELVICSSFRVVEGEIFWGIVMITLMCEFYLHQVPGN